MNHNDLSRYHAGLDKAAKPASALEAAKAWAAVGYEPRHGQGLAFTSAGPAVFVRYLAAAGVSVAAFVGKSAKPAKWYRFRDAARADAFMAEFAANATAVELRKAERAAEKAAASAAFVNPHKVGDILYASWGYDQTNIDFYVVLEVAARSVTIAKCGSEFVRSDGAACEYVKADGKALEPGHVHRVGLDGSVKVRDWGVWAHKWDGREKYETAAGWGH